MKNIVRQRSSRHYSNRKSERNADLMATTDRHDHRLSRVCWAVMTLLMGLCACQAPTSVLPTLAVLPTRTSAPRHTPAIHPTETASVTLAPAASSSPAATRTATHSPTAFPSATPSATITVTASITPTLAPVVITYDTVYSPSIELRRALAIAVERDRAYLPETHYTVTAIRTMDDWAKITLVPTEIVEGGWRDLHQLRFVELYAHQVDGQTWLAFSAATAPPVPLSFVNHHLPPVTGDHLFPWREGVIWWATQGWHEGFALDFQPLHQASTAVLATQAGILREICYDGFQSLLQIDHADGIQTYYMHLRVAGSVRRQRLDQTVVQGQLLGYLYNGSRPQTPCGRVWTAHLHFVASDPTLLLDGISLTDIAAVASCCQAPPTYTSSNVMHLVEE